MAKPLVVIFARAPRYGAVKTRLARDIGASETLRFYRKVLGDLVRRLRRDGRFGIELAVTPDRVRDGWPPVRVIAQGPGDLGRRMVRALRGAGVRPTVVIGSDIPDITTAHVASAFAALGRAPFVLGPARDGGYWLIGARHPQQMRASVLDGVRWSGAHTMRDTADRLGDVAVLDTVLDDIDDGAAYRRYLSRR
ncbi:MAG: glycosyltransferase [Alphaproteobacteria bacterium]|nr:glycosyltransferase [Alphaproteobacteria bacterium]